MRASGSEINLKKDEVLYREGDANNSAFVIYQGDVILHRLEKGKRVDIETRGAGSVVGELSILTDCPRLVTVEALTDCRLYRLCADKIYHRFERLDPVLRACVERSINLSSKLHDPRAAPESVDTDARATPPIPRDFLEVLRLENDIAIGLERGEFSMVYQPIVQLSDERVMGFEALMRWQHPVLGNVPPDRFIRVAEDMGTIGPLTEFALSKACETLKRMRAKPGCARGLFMSVNVSGGDIGRSGFTDYLGHVMDLNDLRQGDLRLEITETSLVPSSETARANLRRLQKQGIGISVDDFGTGYSNLGYLKHLPLTALKIDRAFAGDAHDNAVSRGIVRMLVALGRELGVDIVAEGLETPETVALLRKLGCRLAQGYQFFKPLAEAQAFEVAAGGKGLERQTA